MERKKERKKKKKFEGKEKFVMWDGGEVSGWQLKPGSNKDQREKAIKEKQNTVGMKM